MRLRSAIPEGQNRMSFYTDIQATAHLHDSTLAFLREATVVNCSQMTQRWASGHMKIIFRQCHYLLDEPLFLETVGSPVLQERYPELRLPPRWGLLAFNIPRVG